MCGAAVADDVPHTGNEIAAARDLLYRELREGVKGMALYGLAGVAAVEGKEDEAFERLAAAAKMKPEVIARWAGRGTNRTADDGAPA